MRAVTLDPGKKLVYGAIFVGGECEMLAEYDPYRVPLIERSGYEVAIVEKPSIQGSPNAEDMVNALWGGALAASALSALVVPYSVPTWKGNIKKPLHHLRGWAHLTPYERKLFPSNALDVINAACERNAKFGHVSGYSQLWHNHLDAVLLGLFHFKRTGRGATRITKK